MSSMSQYAWCVKDGPSAGSLRKALFVKSRRGFAAACTACQTTISGGSQEDLDVNLDSHFKAHEPKAGYFWCTKCQTSLGTHAQESTVTAHSTCKKHTKQRKTHLCLTCGTFDPVRNHGSGTHEVIELDDEFPVAGQSAPAEASSSVKSGAAAAKPARETGSFPMIMAQEMRITCKGKLSFGLPCYSCFPTDLPTKKTGVDCKVCLLTGEPTPGKARLALIAPPPSLLRPPVKPKQSITKAEWMTLDEEVQDLYAIPSRRAGKNALCQLDNGSWEDYKQEKSFLSKVEHVDIVDNHSEDSDEEESERGSGSGEVAAASPKVESDSVDIADTSEPEE